MNIELVKKIADAVMYEGHMLYPYRPSSVKNQQPFTFGTLAPGAGMQTECLFQGDDRTETEVTVRFLQDSVERTVTVSGQRESAFSFPPVEGEVTVQARLISEGLYKLTVLVRNTTAVDNPEPRLCMVSTHAILSIRGGELISMTDPPDELREAAGACQNTGVWPVLVGDPGSRDCILASPIILYDYPEIAPESPGELFDGTEIDEILTLRIMTMTEEEKEEMRHADERTRRILERTEALAPEQLRKLHGALRNPHGFPVGKP